MIVSLRSAFARTGAATANRPRSRTASASFWNAQSRLVSTWKSFLVISHALSLATTSTSAGASSGQPTSVSPNAAPSPSG